MNLEMEKRGGVSNFIAGGIAGGILGYLLGKYGDRHILTHTIPPIIIKPSLGDVEIECDEDLEDTPSTLLQNSSAVQQSTILSRTYYRQGFNAALGIEVQYYDLEFVNAPFIYYTPLSQGVRVEIWLQRMPPRSESWEWVNLATPQIIIRATGTDLEIVVDTPLRAKETKKHPKRKVKHKYNGNPNTDYRLGRIYLYNGTLTSPFGRYSSDPADDHHYGDQYSIAFHNQP